MHHRAPTLSREAEAPSLQGVGLAEQVAPGGVDDGLLDPCIHTVKKEASTELGHESPLARAGVGGATLGALGPSP
jgi:hypothetical protein